MRQVLPSTNGRGHGKRLTYRVSGTFPYTTQPMQQIDFNPSIRTHLERATTRTRLSIRTTDNYYITDKPVTAINETPDNPEWQRLILVGECPGPSFVVAVPTEGYDFPVFLPKSPDNPLTPAEPRGTIRVIEAEV